MQTVNYKVDDTVGVNYSGSEIVLMGKVISVTPRATRYSVELLGINGKTTVLSFNTSGRVVGESISRFSMGTRCLGRWREEWEKNNAKVTARNVRLNLARRLRAIDLDTLDFDLLCWVEKVAVTGICRAFLSNGTADTKNLLGF